MSLGLFCVCNAIIAHLQCEVKCLNIWAGEYVHQMPRHDYRTLHTMCIVNKWRVEINIGVRLILHGKHSERLWCNSLQQQFHFTMENFNNWSLKITGGCQQTQQQSLWLHQRRGRSKNPSPSFEMEFWLSVQQCDNMSSFRCVWGRGGQITCSHFTLSSTWTLLWRTWLADAFTATELQKKWLNLKWIRNILFFHNIKLQQS